MYKLSPGQTLSVTPSVCHLSQRERLWWVQMFALRSLSLRCSGGTGDPSPTLLNYQLSTIHSEYPGGLPRHLSALVRNDVLIPNSPKTSLFAS